ncbi:1123_t:CDS:1, partial [Dentiscutata heterogama]
MILYYFIAAVCVQELFELVGVEQICQTTSINLTKFATLLLQKYKQLLQVIVTAVLMHTAFENNSNEINNNNIE